MPSVNYEGLNVSTATGEGDANVLHWGATDKALDRLYQEQQKRKALAQQNYQQQQLAFQKELGAIRSADIPDAVNAYNKRKNIAQQLYFNKKLQHDPIAYAQAQMALKQADADYYGTINGSKEKINQHKGLSDDLYNHPDLYNDDAHEQVMKWQNIPTRDLNAQGLDSPDAIKYKGTNTDYAAMVKTAQGELQDVPIGPETLSKDQQSYQTQYYKRGAQPEQFKNSLIGQFDKRQAGRDAERLLSKIPQEEFIDINKRFDAIPNDQYKRLYGTDKPNLNPKNPDNPVEVIASYEAKKQVVTNPPQPSKVEKRTNIDYAANLAFEHAKQLAAIKQGYAKDLLAAKEKYKKLDKAGQGVYLDSLIENQIKEAKGGGSYTYKTAEGKEIPEYQMKVSPMTKSIFKVNDIYPDAVRIMPNGDIHPIFYRYTKDAKGNETPIIVNGKASIDKTLSQPISREEYKIRLGQQLLSDKGLDKELYDQFGGEDGEENDDEELPFQWK